MNIYLDMDDVVADWIGHARRYLDVPAWRAGQMLPDTQWRSLLNDQRMYRNLEVKEGARELVQWVTEYTTKTKDGLYFLSAIPHGNDMPWAVQDKVFWGQEHFPYIPVFLGPYSHEKFMHCKPNDILIDDRHSNCEEWQRAGGRAHIYHNWPECKTWLEKTLGKTSP